MKLAFEIVAVWTALNFVVGIPVWMLAKTRDRREMLAHGLDYEGSYMSQSSPALANPDLANPTLASPAQSNSSVPNPGVRNRILPLVAGAGRLVPDAGSAVIGAVGRVSTDNRSVTDV
jgi:hypothetical protein